MIGFIKDGKNNLEDKLLEKGVETYILTLYINELNELVCYYSFDKDETIRQEQFETFKNGFVKEGVYNNGITLRDKNGTTAINILANDIEEKYNSLFKK